MATDSPTTAELDRCTKACTAFSKYSELLEKCTRPVDPYIPTLSRKDPEAVILGLALEAAGCRVYWPKEMTSVRS